MPTLQKSGDVICLLCCVRMMSPVPCTLSTMMLCLLKLMKHRIIWSLLLYWRHSTWLGKWEFQFSEELDLKICNWECCSVKKVKVAHIRLSSIGFRSWSQILAVSLQVMRVINPAIGCRYFPSGPPLTLNPQFRCSAKEARWEWTVCLRLLPWADSPTASRLRFEPRPYCAWPSTLTTRLPSHPKTVDRSCSVEFSKNGICGF